MSEPYVAPLPPDLDLAGNYIIEWDAVDPTTGATVAGVNISHTSLLVAGSFSVPQTGDVKVGPYMLVPGPSA